MGKHGAVDPAGRRHATFSAMCVAWGVCEVTVRKRLKRGLSLEQALVRGFLCKGSGAVDHTGRRFPTEAAMCQHWGVRQATYESRIKRGLSPERALTAKAAPYSARPRVDHTGQKFESFTAMCRHWGKSASTVDGRMTRGLSLKQALTAPVNAAMSAARRRAAANKGEHQ